MITATELQAKRLQSLDSVLAEIEKKILQCEERGIRGTLHYLAPNDPVEAIVNELARHGFDVTVNTDQDPREAPTKYLSIEWE